MKKWKYWWDSKNFLNARLCTYLRAKTRKGAKRNLFDKVIIWWLRERCLVDDARFDYYA